MNQIVEWNCINSKMTSFSIIITSHNQAQFIREAVESALAQTYRSREVIVVDDGSSDASLVVLEEFSDAIQLVKLEQNVGACRARNAGVSRAKGDFLVFLDGDDLLLPWALSLYNEIVDRKQPNIILSRMRWFEQEAPGVSCETTPTQVEVVDYETLLNKDRPYRASASAFVIRRDAFVQVRGWPTEIFPLEDLAVLLQLCQSGRTVQILAPVTVCYRIHAANTVHQLAACIGALRFIVGKERQGNYPHGRGSRGKRYAFLGGPVLFWMKRAWKGGLYREGLRLFVSGWPMIFAAGIHQVLLLFKGRREAQVMPL